MSHEFEPLEPLTWFVQLERINESLAAMDGEAPDACIRRAYYMSCLAPGPLREVVQTAMSEELLENFLDCGAYASAVFSLVSRNMSLKIAKAADLGTVRAEVSLSEGEARGVGEHKVLENAVLQAWLQCLLSLRGADGGQSETTDRGRRRSRLAPHRNSTEH